MKENASGCFFLNTSVHVIRVATLQTEAM